MQYENGKHTIQFNVLHDKRGTGLHIRLWCVLIEAGHYFWLPRERRTFMTIRVAGLLLKFEAEDRHIEAIFYLKFKEEADVQPTSV
jgi:hypothetical protein